MFRRFSISAAGVLATSGTVMAGALVDQFNNYHSPGTGFAYIDTFSPASNSQSFIPSVDNICGASIFLGTTWGDDTITLSIYTDDPTDGSAVAVPGATGSAFGTRGNWVDVSWAPVAITAGDTYWLGMRGTDDQSAVVAYTFDDQYPSGDNYYYGVNYGQLYGYDLAFKTWYDVPAPATIALLSLGGLAAARRRRD